MPCPAASYWVSTTSNRYFSRSKLWGIRPEKRLTKAIYQKESEPCLKKGFIKY